MHNDPFVINEDIRKALTEIREELRRINPNWDEVRALKIEIERLKEFHLMVMNDQIERTRELIRLKTENELLRSQIKGIMTVEDAIAAGDRIIKESCTHEKYHYKAAHMPDCDICICDTCGYSWKE